MKRVVKFAKVAVIALAGVMLLFAIIILAFTNMSPQFGESPDEEQLKKFASAANYKDGKFHNQIPTTIGLDFNEGVSVFGKFLFGDKKERKPEAPLPVEKLDSASLADRSAQLARLTWFGHSAVLLEIEGKKILFDPMLGQYAGPVPFVSPRRFNETLPIEISKLPWIDFVIISHDHYDHLDYGSIQQLKEKVGRFFVPWGVGAHLRSWGVSPEIITELNWWEEADAGAFRIVCAPARHFSGRAFSNNRTLWSSWVVKASDKQFYFSGDSGYGPHFKEIGDRYGAMDVVMMECGQYNELWQGIHMLPEETVKASIDVGAKMLLPIHWGAFTLALHSWTDPVNRVTIEAAKFDLPVTTPKIGEIILLNGQDFPDSKWW